jgi:hypothetical protein
VFGTTISGNSSPNYTDFNGGGIANYRTLTLINSTVIVTGGSILNDGTMTVTNTAIVGNSIIGSQGSFGGGIGTSPR